MPDATDAPPAGPLDLTRQTDPLAQAPLTHALSGFLGRQRHDQTVQTDRMFAVIMAVQWAFAVALAIGVSPYTWKGPVPYVHDHVWAAVGLGGLFTLPPVALIALLPGRVVTRHAVAVGQMLMSALLIHLTAGRIETHFHVFGSLAFLALYKDWKVLLTASGVVVVDHFARGVTAPESVFGVAEAAPLLRTLEHGGWVLFEVFFLILTFIRSERALRTVAAEGVRELGQYRLKALLSSGGMGDVYLAEHHMLKRPCAVKIIRPERAGDGQVLARFAREVQATAQLQHPNTVQVYDYGIGTDGTFYYVMEYLAGATVRELVAREGRQPAGRAVHLLRQVCGALREAHAKGLIHRDVNPNNVLVCELGGLTDVVKLLDFGLVLATAAGEEDLKLTHQGVFLGTPEYVSPEQARGGRLDARTDLYGLGAIGYFLLTGEPPFVRPSKVDVLFAHCNEPPIPPSQVVTGVPSDLDAVILRCLAKSPADRFPDAATLDRALAEVEEGVRAAGPTARPDCTSGGAGGRVPSGQQTTVLTVS